MASHALASQIEHRTVRPSSRPWSQDTISRQRWQLIPIEWCELRSIAKHCPPDTLECDHALGSGPYQYLYHGRRGDTQAMTFTHVLDHSAVRGAGNGLLHQVRHQTDYGDDDRKGIAKPSITGRYPMPRADPEPARTLSRSSGRIMIFALYVVTCALEPVMSIVCSVWETIPPFTSVRMG
jgi:hypothetical protein